MNSGTYPLSIQNPSQPLPHSPRFHDVRPSTIRTSPSLESSESDELQHLVHAPPLWMGKKRLTRQLSMMETKRELKWEKRRRQILRHRRRRNVMFHLEDLTDEDFHELKGSIELGFGFNEEAGQQLFSTLPALDIYFAINRHASLSPASSPLSHASSGSMREQLFSCDSPRSQDSWKICSPGLALLASSPLIQFKNYIACILTISIITNFSQDKPTAVVCSQHIDHVFSQTKRLHYYECGLYP